MKESAETTIPEGTAWTLKVPINRDKTRFATFYLKEIDEPVYLAVMSLIDKDKELDATRMMIKSLQVGGDDVSVLSTNLIAALSARKMAREIITPLEGELKKN